MTYLRAVILDFDGVLVESNQAKQVAFDALFARYPEHAEAMSTYHMANFERPRLTKFHHFVYQIMASPDGEELVREMAEQFSKDAVQRIIACPEVRGATAFLREFAGSVPLYVASVTPEEELRTIVNARGIATLITSAYGDPPHPKVDAVRGILERERIAPAQALLIGDSLSDYEVARCVGVEFLGRGSDSFGQETFPVVPDLKAAAEMLRPRIQKLR